MLHTFVNEMMQGIAKVELKMYFLQGEEIKGVK